MKDPTTERKALWLEVYSKEYQRQIPLSSGYGGSYNNKEAARRAGECADTMIADLQEREEREVHGLDSSARRS